VQIARAGLLPLSIDCAVAFEVENAWGYCSIVLSPGAFHDAVAR
jgi:hypothetical protein